MARPTVALAIPAGRWIDEIGPRAAFLSAVLGFGTSSALAAAAAPALWTLSVAWRLSVIGAGKGLFMGPNQTAILAAVPPEATATVGGVSAVWAGLVAALAFTTIASACCLAIPSRTSVQIARDSGAAGNLRAAGP